MLWVEALALWELVVPLWPLRTLRCKLAVVCSSFLVPGRQGSEPSRLQLLPLFSQQLSGADRQLAKAPARRSKDAMGRSPQVHGQVLALAAAEAGP